MFTLKKKTQDVEPNDFMRFISESTSPNFYWSDDIRCENRYNRTIPVMIAPWKSGKPQTKAVTIAITKDVSKEGACLISTDPVEESDIVIGFWIDVKKMPEPWFFHAVVVSCFEVGGGYWQIGTNIDKILDAIPDGIRQTLHKKAMVLLPPQKHDLSTS